MSFYWGVIDLWLTYTFKVLGSCREEIKQFKINYLQVIRCP